MQASGDPPSDRRVIAFVDNAGADIVLGMLPLARELLRMGSEVVLAANTQPAINDITAGELRTVVAAAARDDPILAAAWEAGLQAERANRSRVRHCTGVCCTWRRGVCHHRRFHEHDYDTGCSRRKARRLRCRLALCVTMSSTC